MGKTSESIVRHHLNLIRYHFVQHLVTQAKGVF